MSAGKTLQDRGPYIGFPLFDKEKNLSKILRIPLSEEEFFADLAKKFDDDVRGFEPVTDLSLSLKGGEYYSIRGDYLDSLLDGNEINIGKNKDGNFKDLYDHLAIRGNTAALVFERHSPKTQYFFLVSTGVFKAKAAFIFQGEKIVRDSSNRILIAESASLRLCDEEMAVLNLGEASKLFPIAKKRQDLDRNACEELYRRFESAFSPFSVGKASARKLSIGRQIFEVVEEMGEERYLESVKRAAATLDKSDREKLFDSEGRITIDFKNETILNFLAENSYRGSLSKSSYVATAKRKK